MKQNETTRLYHFESHDEIRNYLAQGIGKDFENHVYLTTRQNATVSLTGAVIADCNEDGEPYVIKPEDNAEVYHGVTHVYDYGYSIRTAIGQVEDYPAEDYAVTKIWQVVEIEADTVVKGFYKAGEHLAKHVHTVGTERTKFTTKDLTAVKNGVRLEGDDESTAYLYRIKTQTGFYRCHQDSLWWMMLKMEQAEGVGPAKRKVFIIRGEEEAQEATLRLSFTIDKEVQRLKQCLATDDTMPFLCHPAIDTAAGVIVGSNGHILTVHKLTGYEQDLQSGLPAWAQGILSVPKEVCQMKGTVTVTAVDGRWEESVEKDDHSTELREVDGIIVTATDENGRQGVLKVSQYFLYPNWRRVIPSRIGPAISVDMKKLAEGVKRIMPQLNGASQMVTLSASAGDKHIVLSGEDYDFSKSGSVKVELLEEMPCGMRVGLKAPTVLTATGFQVNAMHYKGAGLAVMFIGDNTLTIQMPMLIDGKYIERGPKPTDGQLEAFDINKWCDKTVEAKAKAASKREKKDACISSSECEQARHDSGNTKAKTKKSVKKTTDKTDRTDKPVAVKVKGTDYTVKSDGHSVTFGSYIPKALAETHPSDIGHQASAMTLAEQLRQALLAKLAA